MEEDKRAYECYLCGGVFEVSAEDERAAYEEGARSFPEAPPQVMQPVCDPCFGRVMEFYPELKTRYEGEKS